MRGALTGPRVGGVEPVDHPRIRGEHGLFSTPDGLVGGSSPRMRGARTSRDIRVLPPRIIPADAGSTRRPKPETTAQKDHPRGCGEHHCTRPARDDKTGSSPRMRGARYHHVSTSGRDRIIPADAGSTWSRGPGKRPGPDHPRGCGEHCWAGVSRASP